MNILNQIMPFKSYPAWLSIDEADDVLEFIQKRKSEFVAGGVYSNGMATIDSELRNVLLQNFECYRDFFERKALAVQPELEKAFGITPFKASRTEVDFLAYGNGSHFKEHIDTVLHRDRDHPRTITLVLYLQKTPACYSGGELNFHALIGKEAKTVIPQHNMMVAFPSISPHSVTKISCPSDDFSDFRFAIVIWIHR